MEDMLLQSKKSTKAFKLYPPVRYTSSNGYCTFTVIMPLENWKASIDRMFTLLERRS